MTGSHGLIVSTTHMLGYTACSADTDFPVSDHLEVITQLMLSTWMFILIVLRFIQESVQMYKATNRIRLGHYQTLIVWDGLVYFIAHVHLSFVRLTALIVRQCPRIWTQLPAGQRWTRSSGRTAGTGAGDTTDAAIHTLSPVRLEFAQASYVQP